MSLCRRIISGKCYLKLFLVWARWGKMRCHVICCFWHGPDYSRCVALLYVVPSVGQMGQDVLPRYMLFLAWARWGKMCCHIICCSWRGPYGARWVAILYVVPGVGQMGQGVLPFCMLIPVWNEEMRSVYVTCYQDERAVLIETSFLFLF